MFLMPEYGIAQKSHALALEIQKELGEESLPIYNGVRFYDALRSNKENFRYFERYRPYDATIHYNGVTYVDIKTRYDLLNDHLIIYSPGEISFFQVKLANRDIDRFQLGSSKFIRADLSEKFNKKPDAFYEVHYTSTTMKLLISWKKTEKIQPGDGTPYYTFNTSSEYYLGIGSQYHQVKTRRDFIKLFPDFKDEIRNFYKAYRRMERNNPKKFMKDLVFFLDQGNKERNQ